MSEVTKTVVRYSRDFQGNLSVDPNGSWVLAADAAINAKRLMNHIDRVTAERDALQQRLTAADERADVLERLLRKAHPFTNDVANDVDVWLEIDAALKPAEPATDEHVCTGCGSKGWTANCKECVPF